MINKLVDNLIDGAVTARSNQNVIVCVVMVSMSAAEIISVQLVCSSRHETILNML